jgi:hypothetical protein
MRRIAVPIATLAALVFAAPAGASFTSVMDGDLQCATVTSAGNVSGSLGQRWCGSVPAHRNASARGPAVGRSGLTSA